MQRHGLIVHCHHNHLGGAVYVSLKLRLGLKRLERLAPPAQEMQLEPGYRAILEGFACRYKRGHREG